jgi:hypothetical protein
VRSKEPPALHRRMAIELIDEHRRPALCLRLRRLPLAQDRRIEEIPAVRCRHVQDLLQARLGINPAIHVHHARPLACRDCSLHARLQRHLVQIDNARITAEKHRHLRPVRPRHHRYAGRHRRRTRIERMLRYRCCPCHGSELPCPLLRHERGRQQRVDGKIVQPVQLLSPDAELLQQLPRPFIRHSLGLQPQLTARLDDTPMEQPLRRHDAHQRRRFPSPARLPEDQHAAGVAAEPIDILLDPFQGQHAVQHPRGRAVRIGAARNVIEIEITEHVEPVVDRYDHHILLHRHPHAVIPGRRSRPGREPAAMQPHHNGLLPREVVAPYVQHEAVFRLRTRR